MQNEITRESNVFSESGQVQNAGWSRKPVFNFDKSLCKNRMSLHECDSYLIADDKVSIYLSVAENGLNSQVTAIVADHVTGEIDSRTLKKYMSFGGLDMPASSKNGDVTFTNARVGMNFSNTALKRYIRCEFVNFSKDKNLYINVMLEDTIDESLNVLVPVKNESKGFYLRRFMPAMKASGVVRCGGAEYKLTADTAIAFLNWQRYNTKDINNHHALYADTKLEDGRQFSLCLAGGIGDPSMGSENCYFLDGIIHKFASVKAQGNEDRPDKPWTFTAGNSAMNITFRPEIKAGHLMGQKCKDKFIVFGKLFGHIKQLETEKIVLDAIPAQLEFSII